MQLDKPHKQQLEARQLEEQQPEARQPEAQMFVLVVVYSCFHNYMCRMQPKDPAENNRDHFKLPKTILKQDTDAVI